MWPKAQSLSAPFFLCAGLQHLFIYSHPPQDGLFELLFIQNVIALFYQSRKELLFFHYITQERCKRALSKNKILSLIKQNKTKPLDKSNTLFGINHVRLLWIPVTSLLQKPWLRWNVAPHLILNTLLQEPRQSSVILSHPQRTWKHGNRCLCHNKAFTFKW